jgi:hypothetical protein
VDIYREETERRWQIQRIKTKEIHESQTEGGDSLGEEEKQKQIYETDEGKRRYIC